jgi:hypothetical protein
MAVGRNEGGRVPKEHAKDNVEYRRRLSSALRCSGASAISVVALVGERCRLEVLRKAPALPVTFLNGLSSGPDGVGGGVGSVGGGVGGRGGMSGGAGGSSGLCSVGLAGGGVDGERGGARLAHLYHSTCSGTRRLDGPPGPVVFRELLLEAREDALGAVRGP